MGSVDIMDLQIQLRRVNCVHIGTGVFVLTSPIAQHVFGENSWLSLVCVLVATLRTFPSFGVLQ